MQLLDSELCVKCRGRGFCKEPCKIYSKFRMKSVDLNLKQEFQGGSPPSIFIGSKLTYPSVNVGIMSVPDEENPWIYDSPNYWSEKEMNSAEILKFRQGLVNSRFKSNVFDVRKSSRWLEAIKEIGMSSIQSDVEIKLNKKPKPRMSFDSRLLPMGPSAELRKVRIVSNSKISSSVDKVYSDTDLKSVDALRYLYKRGFGEHSLTQLLSVGVTGLKKNRKLVPTRNSITAIDDSIGRYLLTKIRDYPIVNDYFIYYGGHLGNYYLILFFPEIFSYELFETVFPKTTWNPAERIEIMTDYENYKGRKNYAYETAGGYYAARFPILQCLNGMKRQASVLVLRFVLPEYNVPLGVWVCRNSVRKALGSEPVYFNMGDEMLKYVEVFVREKFGFDVKGVLGRSKLLNEVKEQKKLGEWF